MIRIVYVIDSLPSGGAERYLLYLLEGLDRSRYEPIVITVFDEYTIPYHYQNDLNTLQIPIYSLHMPLPIGRVKWLLTAIWRYVMLIWQLNPSLIQSVLYVSNIIARLGRPFCLKSKLINTIHSLDGYNRLQVLRFTEWLCPLTITNSPKTHTYYQNNGIPSEKLKLIPYGFNVQRFSQLAPFTLRHEIVADAEFLALSVIRIHPDKDPLTLCKALALLKPQLSTKFRLLFLGGVTQETLFGELQKYIKEEQLQEWIDFHPSIQNTERYYAAADITILSSIRETFGLVVVESLAAGVPVIISESANVLGIIETDKTGWVFPTGDPDALAKCLLEAINMPQEQRQAMGARGREVAQEYSVEKMVASYHALYQQLMAP